MRPLTCSRDLLAFEEALSLPFARLIAEAVKALTCALTARDVQYPPLLLLSQALSAWSSSAQASSEVARASGRLALDVAHILALSHGVTAAFERPLFEAKKARRDKSDPWDGQPAAVDTHILADAKELDDCCHKLELDSRTTGRMHALYGKFHSMVKRGEAADDDDDDDKGVRNL